MLRIGLTGGIATGKSYARLRFAAHGVATIDADALAREVVAPGTPGLAAVAARFGPQVLDGSGALDRPAMAAIVFADAEARRALEAIVHPRVRAAIDEFFVAQAQAGAPLAMADIPLLFESGRAGAFDLVIVVACSPEQQIARLRARDGLGEDAARQRLAAQWPIDEKARLADIVIDTSGDFESTDRQIDDVFRQLTARSTQPHA
jgi:dephospho-CoA kinase